MTNTRQLFDDLVRTKALLWSGIDRELIAGGVIGLGPLSMLGAIGAMGRCRVQDLAIDAVITTGGASQAVDRLVNQGLCRRVSNPDDRRSSLVELTPQGRETLSAAEGVFSQVLDTYLKPLSASERASLATSLRTLRAHAADKP